MRYPDNWGKPSRERETTLRGSCIRLSAYFLKPPYLPEDNGRVALKLLHLHAAKLPFRNKDKIKIF